MLRTIVRTLARHPYASAAVAVGAAVAARRVGAPAALGTLLAVGAAGTVVHAGMHATGRMTAAEMLSWKSAQ